MAPTIVLKYLLSLTIYLDNGSAITKFNNDQLYPTHESCTAAGEAWKKTYKENSQYKCKLINEKHWK